MPFLLWSLPHWSYLHSLSQALRIAFRSTNSGPLISRTLTISLISLTLLRLKLTPSCGESSWGWQAGQPWRPRAGVARGLTFVAFASVGSCPRNPGQGTRWRPPSWSGGDVSALGCPSLLAWSGSSPGSPGWWSGGVGTFGCRLWTPSLECLETPKKVKILNHNLIKRREKNSKVGWLWIVRFTFSVNSIVYKDKYNDLESFLYTESSKFILVN